jgi:hypothetical protein
MYHCASHTVSRSSKDWSRYAAIAASTTTPTKRTARYTDIAWMPGRRAMDDTQTLGCWRD